MRLTEKDAKLARRLAARVLKAERARNRLLARSAAPCPVGGPDRDGRAEELLERTTRAHTRATRRMTQFILSRTGWRPPALGYCDPSDAPQPALVVDGSLWTVLAEHLGPGEWEYGLARVVLADALTV